MKNARWQYARVKQANNRKMDCASDFQEQLSKLDVAPLTSNIFTSIENTISDWWSRSLKDETLKAGAEERRKAIEKDESDRGSKTLLKPTKLVVDDQKACPSRKTMNID
ncbi:hypothetical protein DPMN_113078 [Dreissena polymorpha]|uniref:Uncharacterized protein n=1 Tax=Dreissena polymorpha TaxID=45954 RepID=A0A9D4KHB1_DREPO|nr:hypothetical protein DPMN_113078 [Dreissena polymorpha]